MIEIIVNGEPYQTQASDVATLLAERGMSKQTVAVELNREVVPKRSHTAIELKAGDTIELVSLVGGG